MAHGRNGCSGVRGQSIVAARGREPDEYAAEDTEADGNGDEGQGEGSRIGVKGHEDTKCKGGYDADQQAHASGEAVVPLRTGFLGHKFTFFLVKDNCPGAGQEGGVQRGAVPAATFETVG